MQRQAGNQAKGGMPVLPELNEFYRLTNEDHMIFRRRTTVETQGRYHKADRADAQLLLAKQWPYQTYLPRALRVRS
jgi:hypothetical protein